MPQPPSPRQPRRSLVYYLEVMNRDTDAPFGRVVDLTTGGAKILSDAPSTVGEVYRLQIVWDREELGVEHLLFEGECMWCQTDVNPDYYVSGFRFVAPGPALRRQIERVINTIGFSESE